MSFFLHAYEKDLKVQFFNQKKKSNILLWFVHLYEKVKLLFALFKYIKTKIFSKLI